MNAITRYFPAFVGVDDSERVTVEFETQDQLEEIPWVKSRKSRDFEGFAFNSDKKMVFAMYADGTHWGLGRVRSSDGLNYPTLKEAGRL